MIKKFEEFILLEKNYTPSMRKKDVRRIEDIVEKGQKAADKRGSNPDEEMIKLAVTQANRIKDYDKAHNRGLAAESENLHDVAKVFFDRAKELNEHLNESKKVDTDTYKELNIKSMIQVVDADDNNNGNAKITKKSKTLYYVSWSGKKWKVKIEDVSINVHGQAQVDDKDLMKMK